MYWVDSHNISNDIKQINAKCASIVLCLFFNSLYDIDVTNGNEVARNKDFNAESAAKEVECNLYSLLSKTDVIIYIFPKQSW